jgi:Fe(3+) dicitrate transport protein
MDSLLYRTQGISIEGQKRSEFGIDRLKAIEGTQIYAAKKNEVIQVDQLNANLAANQARQVYAKVPGLNTWESDGTGLQLDIGARGLSPKRASNFNTRQNGYDISADALGYPESYYTPPNQALRRIEVVRGAGALQYGTQFGGMVNFIFKDGPEDQPIEFHTEQTGGSYKFFNSFNRLGGTLGAVNYYGFYQYKRSDGWRPNSKMQQHTGHLSLDWEASRRLSLSLEATHMNYTARQPGGLSDQAFEADPTQSLRERNWFRVNWNILGLSMNWDITDRTRLASKTFGLVAGREALGHLGRISRPDPGGERDLFRDQFRNIGHETRLLHRYQLFGEPSAISGGVRFFKGYTFQQQGDANESQDADFQLLRPNNPTHSQYHYPSTNVAAFAEHLFRLTDRLTVTPGVRYEHIETYAQGFYFRREKDFAGNVLFEEKLHESRQRIRNFALLGVGVAYDLGPSVELYGNFTQNYRGVNFNDLRTVNPNLRVDKQIQDERGYNADLGVRGQQAGVFTYDASAFFMRYDRRIGAVIRKDTSTLRVYRYRTNVADTRTYGIESFGELGLMRLFWGKSRPFDLSVYANAAVLRARYINARSSAIEGRQVELVPEQIVRTGLTVSWHNLAFTTQFSYTGHHYTDATNAERVPGNSAIGEIPAYHVLDATVSYQWRFLEASLSINNLTDHTYFTRRATGYPGPGIIPAQPRSIYLTLGATL